MTKTINKIITKIDRKKLHNNTQKVLLTLLNAGGEWIARTSVRTPSATSRMRDLRKEKFGSFKVECASAADLNKKNRSTKTKQITFYRICPESVTYQKVSKIFEVA